MSAPGRQHKKNPRSREGKNYVRNLEEPMVMGEDERAGAKVRDGSGSRKRVPSDKRQPVTNKDLAGLAAQERDKAMLFKDERGLFSVDSNRQDEILIGEGIQQQ